MYYMRLLSAPALQGIATTYLDTVDGGLFFVYNNCVHVSTENYGNRQLILPLSWFTQVNNTPTDACE